MRDLELAVRFRRGSRASQCQQQCHTGASRKQAAKSLGTQQ